MRFVDSRLERSSFKNHAEWILKRTAARASVIFLFRVAMISECHPLPSILRIARTPRFRRLKGSFNHLEDGQ